MAAQGLSLLYTALALHALTDKYIILPYIPRHTIDHIAAVDKLINSVWRIGANRLSTCTLYSMPSTYRGLWLAYVCELLILLRQMPSFDTTAVKWETIYIQSGHVVYSVSNLIILP